MTAGAASRESISVVVPTRDHPDMALRCAQAVVHEAGGDVLEIILVDDGSAEPLADRPAPLPDIRVRVIRHARARGPAAARNTGWRSARGAIVLFLDDDVTPRPGYWRALRAALRAAPEAPGVEGPIVPAHDGGDTEPLSRTHRTSGGGHTGNVAYRRAVLEQLAGFDEAFPAVACEDYDLCWRVVDAFGPLVLAAEMIVVHPVLPPESLTSAWRRRSVARPSQLRLFAKHPHRFPPAFMPAWALARLHRWLRPGFGGVLRYLVLGSCAQLVSWRRLMLTHPWRFARWSAFLAVDIVRTLAEAPRLAAHYAALEVELMGRGSRSDAP